MLNQYPEDIYILLKSDCENNVKDWLGRSERLETEDHNDQPGGRWLRWAKDAGIKLTEMKLIRHYNTVEVSNEVQRASKNGSRMSHSGIWKDTDLGGS